MLKQLSLAWKMVLILLVPLIGLLVFGVQGVQEKETPSLAGRSFDRRKRDAQKRRNRRRDANSNKPLPIIAYVTGSGTADSRNVFEMLTTAPPLAEYASDTCREVTFVAIGGPGFPGTDIKEPLTAPPPFALSVFTLFGVPVFDGLETSPLTCRILVNGGAIVMSMATSYDTVKLARKFPWKVTVWKS